MGEKLAKAGGKYLDDHGEGEEDSVFYPVSFMVGELGDLAKFFGTAWFMRPEKGKIRMTILTGSHRNVGKDRLRTVDELRKLPWEIDEDNKKASLP